MVLLSVTRIPYLLQNSIVLSPVLQVMAYVVFITPDTIKTIIKIAPF